MLDIVIMNNMLKLLELSPRVGAPCAFMFHETDWDEPSVLRAYKVRVRLAFTRDCHDQLCEV